MKLCNQIIPRTPMKLMRCGLIILLTILMPLMLTGAAPPRPTPSRPNVIVLLADDLGYGDVGCYGANPGHIRTPNIDRLAREGIRFTDGHSASSVCTPSRYSLLTGEYPFRSKRGGRILPGDAPLAIVPGSFTLPAMFQKSGYATGIVGKWHVSRIGFMTGGKAACWKDGQMSDILTDEAIKFIEKHKERPFFLYFATHGIHEPRVPHARFTGKSGAGVYGDHTEELDDAVGRVLAALDRLKLADKTLLIFSSDNGATDWVGYDYGPRANLNGHKVNGVLRGEKGTLWEGGTRVPFIVRWPGHVPAGETSAVLVSQTDLLASCARLLGTKLPNGAARDSAEVLDALLGKSGVGRREWVVNQFNAKCALRVDNWKWVEGQLYDLSSDLSETRNLVGEQPGRAKAMSARLIELMK